LKAHIQKFTSRFMQPKLSAKTPYRVIVTPCGEAVTTIYSSITLGVVYTCTDSE